jgi:hypothetical protein
LTIVEMSAHQIRSKMPVFWWAFLECYGDSLGNPDLNKEQDARSISLTTTGAFRLALAVLAQAILDALENGQDAGWAEEWLLTTGASWLEIAGFYQTPAQIRKSLSKFRNWSKPVRRAVIQKKSTVDNLEELLEVFDSELPGRAPFNAVERNKE